MLDALKSLFSRSEPPPAPAAATTSPAPSRLEVAACAILLEIAHADDEFAIEERRHIERVVMHHFDLGGEEARELMAVADEARREALDLHQFTGLINRHYDEGQRMVLAELMWRIVMADGTLSQHESTLARKVASLLELRPGYLSEAKKRAEEAGGPGAS